MTKTATIHALKHRQRAAPRDEDSVVDKRAVAIGLALSGTLAAIGLVWKLNADGGTLRKPEDFLFAVNAPKTEEFKINEIVRTLVEPTEIEKVDAVKTDLPAVTIAPQRDDHSVPQPQPDPTPSDRHLPDPTITSGQIDVADPRVDPPDPGPIDRFAPTPIACPTTAPADLYQVKEPTPRDQVALSHLTARARPGLTLDALPKAFGAQGGAANLGPLGTASLGAIGIGTLPGNPGTGNEVKSRSAVDAALHWLALHQEMDGGWRADKHEGVSSTSLADTGFACLAFLGGGHTPRQGTYRRNVLKGIQSIIRRQKADGRFQDQGENLYTHAICTIAVAEAFGRSRDDELRAAAQKAVDFCIASQNDDGGWRYAPKTGTSDVSVTAWFIQALKTARIAGLVFDSQAFARAGTYLDSLTDQGGAQDSSGQVGYEYAASQTYSGHPALTAAGMVIRQFSGTTGVRNHLLKKGAEATRQMPPTWKGGKDFYHWYYATYAMHNMSGEYRLWWNQRIRDVLLDHQSRDGDHAGSWDPTGDKWVTPGGRVCTTALGALCLEVYYRYSASLGAFEVPPSLDDLLDEVASP